MTLAVTRAPDLAVLLQRDLARYGLRSAKASEVAPARALAAALIGEAIVSASDFARIQRVSNGAALFLAHEDEVLTGILAFMLLSDEGRRAIHAGAFDALSPRESHLAAPGEPARAFYGWGVAATTKDSARRLIGGARDIMSGVLAHLPKFARPTTEAGHRLMRDRLGFVDLPQSGGLVWQAPLQERAAA